MNLGFYWVMVAHTFKPSTKEVEAGRFLWVWGQPAVQSEFQDNQGYTRDPVSKKKKNQDFFALFWIKGCILNYCSLLYLYIFFFHFWDYDIIKSFYPSLSISFKAKWS
jgi:hypothetical protein